MKHSRIAALAIIAALALPIGACSSTQLANFKAKLANFNAAVLQIDQSIAEVSPVLFGHCNDAIGVIATLQGLNATFDVTNTAVIQGVAATRAAFTSFCSAPPTNLASAITGMIAAVVEARAAIQVAKGP